MLISTFAQTYITSVEHFLTFIQCQASWCPLLQMLLQGKQKITVRSCSALSKCLLPFLIPSVEVLLRGCWNGLYLCSSADWGRQQCADSVWGHPCCFSILYLGYNDTHTTSSMLYATVYPKLKGQHWNLCANAMRNINHHESKNLKKRNDNQEHLETTEKGNILNSSTLHKIAADSVKVPHFMYL